MTRTPSYFEHNDEATRPTEPSLLIDMPELYDKTDNHFVGRRCADVWAQGHKPPSRTSMATTLIVVAAYVGAMVALYVSVWHWTHG